MLHQAQHAVVSLSACLESYHRKALFQSWNKPLHIDATANYNNWNKIWKQQDFFQESHESVKVIKSSQI